ncbi:uncharacterized protein MONBRDRAFT_25095 [Monosiga brevicollis MX1]|uniref:Mitogen-activated protein kinase kinase kinase n=1 Tax=Monosiga brevicollis TaxID=81824 RepID=A9UYE3_MONBE|nr:uncharacterized protein MONBRDRAFT_25095 [Monosiga brevicollis MX1]EDQ89590.1 predicted protein [Monosiga brevicollis MX1]|eukprot:XP_001745619.1 hypothetical protein [Monosiga brevicollis MX1]
MLPTSPVPARRNSRIPVRTSIEERDKSSKRASTALERRIDAVLSSVRLYYLGKVGPFAFLIGNDDQRYKVVLGPQTCSGCRQEHCCHLLFVLLKLLKLHRDNPLIRRSNIHDYEIKSMVNMFNEAEEAKKQRCLSHATTLDSEEGCPICLVQVVEGESATRCATCRNAIHLHCMTVLAHGCRAIGKQTSCPICRSEWQALTDPVITDESTPSAPQLSDAALKTNAANAANVDPDSLLWLPEEHRLHARRCFTTLATDRKNSVQGLKEQMSKDLLSELMMAGVVTLDMILTTTCTSPPRQHLSTRLRQWFAGHLTTLIHLNEHYSGLISASPTVIQAAQRSEDLNFFSPILENWRTAVFASGHQRIIRMWKRLSRCTADFRADDTLAAQQASSSPSCEALSQCSGESLVADEFEDTDSCASPEPAAVPSVDEDYREGTHWERRALLGRGATGQVYEIKDLASGQLLAVKEIGLPATMAPSKRVSQVARFESEFDLIDGIGSHTNLVRYFGTNATPSHVCLYLELLKGGSLLDLLHDQGALDSVRAVTCLVQVANGIAHLHKAGIIHRDIKAANVLLTEEGVAKLTDFSDARALAGHETQEGEIHSTHGSPAYMAPEVIRGAHIGRASDVWQLGCLCIELLTAHPPWHELSCLNAFALMFHIAGSDSVPARPNTDDARLTGLMDACLQRDPGDRQKIRAIQRLLTGSDES